MQIKRFPFFNPLNPDLPGAWFLDLDWERPSPEHLTPEEFAAWLADNPPSAEAGLGIVIASKPVLCGRRSDEHEEELSSHLADMLSNLNQEGPRLDWIKHLWIMTKQKMVQHSLATQLDLNDQVLCGDFTWRCYNQVLREQGPGTDIWEEQACGRDNIFPNMACQSSDCRDPHEHDTEVTRFARHCGWQG